MADLEVKDLVSFDELVTPRIVPFAFWLFQAVNAVFWLAALVSGAKTDVPESVDFETGQTVAAHADFHWTKIITCLVMVVVGAVVIRVVCDLVLCVFRWQASTRGILMALTGAPLSLAQAQGGTTSGPPRYVAAPAAAAAPAHPAVAPVPAAGTSPTGAPQAGAPPVVSPQPPWEQGAAPQAPAPPRT